MNRALVAVVLLAAAGTALLASEEKKPLTNADVVKLVKAELPEATIILAIQNSDPAFDTSPDGGRKAALRMAEKTPAFEMILPNNVQASSVLALALLGERKNGTREILIAGGYMAFSAGLPKDRNIALEFDRAADQSQAPEGYEVYAIKPSQPLAAGEYAFMVVKGEGMAAGVFGPGAGASYHFYEFAVE